MIPTHLSLLANHLWQSTLFAAAAGLLTLAFRKHRAGVRYGLWFAASVKFLIPFSLLVALGGQFEWRTAPALTRSRIPFSIEPVAQPFTPPAPRALPVRAPAVPSRVPAILFAVWLAGFLVNVVRWFRGWHRIRVIVHAASPLPLDLPIPARSTAARLGPGVFGIRRPVLLLPDGIAERLTPPQLDSIVAHELCHVRRHDNLSAAIHMSVEALFWFHPLVWWIETRLVEERERACDEAVLHASRDPEVYAEGILTVCKFCLTSPLACVSGVSGANLKQRIESIMLHRQVHNLTSGGKLLLAAVGLMALAGPFAIGLGNAGLGNAQSQSSPPLAFEVASVKPNKSGAIRAPSMILPGGRFTATNNTLRALILNAYGISASPYLLSGGPAWIDSEAYDVDAKAAANAIPPGASNRVLWEKTRLMLRTLLADRFHLVIRSDAKELPVYELAVARNGSKLNRAEQDCTASLTACHGFSGNPTRLSGPAVDMTDLALTLSSYSDRPVLDKTGIQGLFDIKLQWNPFAGRAQSPEDVQRSPGAEAREGRNPDLDSLPTLFTALEQQLGLKLESRKGPIEIYVIDHVERPSEN
jgi:uncharacterized protein (TIGR03435 family)